MERPILELGLSADPAFYTESRHLANLVITNPSGYPWTYLVRLKSDAFVDGYFEWTVPLGAGKSETLHNWFTMVAQAGAYPCSAEIIETTTSTVFPPVTFDPITLTVKLEPEFYLAYYEPWSVEMGEQLPWTFHPSTAFLWMLDNSIYVSPPSSLRLTSSLQYSFFGLLCNVPATWNLPEGRLVTSFQNPNYYVYPRFLFRNQSPTYPEHAIAGNAMVPTNTYSGYFSSMGCHVTKRGGVGPTWSNYWRWPQQLIYNTWYTARISWFNFANGLVVRAEFWDGTQWVALTPDGFDSNPWWSDSAINRVGVGYGRPNFGGYTRFDDTEIWGV